MGLSLADLTSREAVLEAMREYDLIGKDAFLEKYGFDSAKRYYVEHGGKRYESKAIAGVAVGKQHPSNGPLKSTDFTGGVASVGRKLSDLGFEFIDADGEDSDRSSFGDLLCNAMSLFASEKETPFRKKDELWAAMDAIEERLTSYEAVRRRSHIFCEWSLGAGNWLTIPWIALFDDRVTKSAQSGIYVVLLVSEDLSEVYLTLNQGATELEKEHGRGGARKVLQDRANDYRAYLENLALPDLVMANDVDLRTNHSRSKLYEVGTIAYVHRDNLPAITDAEMEQHLDQLLTAYETLRTANIGKDSDESDLAPISLDIDRSALERLRTRFLAKFPDFQNFEVRSGFDDEEDDYKRALIARAQQLVTAETDDQAGNLGAALLDLLAGQGGLESNLLGWRMVSKLGEVRKAHPSVIEAAAERLVHEVDAIAGVGHFVEETWPALSEGQEANLPYSDSRTIPSMLAALVHPNDVIAVRYQPFHNASMALFNRPLFANAPLSVSELTQAVNLARAIFAVMRDEWGWLPRDLWDVQGFIWVTCQDKLDLTSSSTADDEPIEREKVAMMPANLILYGPPGTGKTFATAEEAVKLCTGSAPADRVELMQLYQSLYRKGRIGFVTFHQSFSYEEFVEGLRPTTGDEEEGQASAGFSLSPHDGIFKQFANLAGENRGEALAGDEPLIDRSQKIFKMSLGRSRVAEDDVIFEDAIRDGYVVLGWGGDVDWSDSRFDDWEAIKERWREDHPEASGNDPNMSQMYAFRINMQVGSLVVISDGNRKFRAIGRITGPYQFVPGPGGEYNHRRPVQWLWHTDESLPRERIYGKEFSQVSAYQLNSRHIDWDALVQVVASGGDAFATTGVPESYVLIIDEINRANISKVFGELITLLEPDKRIGGENELRVKLPYSGEIFGVPANLHVIGTMNTADRSIALLDTALRRRFTFKELMPNPELLPEVLDGVPLRALLSLLNERIEYLFDREHQIGHAYFMGCETRDDIDERMRHRIIPLLAEYFYEDWDKIASVLGDSEGKRFLEKQELQAPGGLDADGDAPPRWRWSVRPYFAADAYSGLA